MISFEQCKHVITYYMYKIMSKELMNIHPHVQRDCVFLNKQRGELCAKIIENPKLQEILLLLHHAKRIEQINTIPDSNKCFIEKKNIPKNNSGIQLIFYSGDKFQHVCIQKKYQKVCYAYFKIRNFSDFIQQYIKSWLLNQDWYLPKTYEINYLVKKILSSRVPKAIHTHLIESVDELNLYT